jgi:site-specific recombinase XerC
MARIRFAAPRLRSFYKATGNLRAVQILLGHTKIENTVRYLGVDIEDALALAEGTEI